MVSKKETAELKTTWEVVDNRTENVKCIFLIMFGANL